MGTELNLDLLRGMGFAPPADAGPNDLVVARARRRTTTPLDRAVAALEQALAAAGRAAGGDGLGGDEPPPRTVGVGRPARRRRRPRPRLGPRAARLHRGDGRARRRACRCWSSATTCRSRPRCGSRTRPRARGLLVMGPDCGTAVVGGVGLGFANAVRPGPVGHRRRQRHRRPAADVHARHPRGRHQPLPRRRRPRPVRGRRRPLHPRGAGAARRRPGHRADRAGVQAARPRRRGRDHGVRRVAGHAGAARPARAGRADTTSPTVARRAVEARRRRPGPSRGRGTASRAPTPGGALRGLFAGGTLCDEAMVIAAAALGDDPARTSRCGPEWARRRGPARRRAPDARLRRRRAHPGPGAPDDRPAQPARPDRGRGAPTRRCGGAAARRGARPRRPPGPGGRARPGPRRGRRHGARRRPGARGRRVAVRHRGRPAGPAPAGRGAARRPAPSVFLSNAAAARHAVARSSRPEAAS